jgi:hypothetical protein
MGSRVSGIAGTFAAAAPPAAVAAGFDGPPLAGALAGAVDFAPPSLVSIGPCAGDALVGAALAAVAGAVLAVVVFLAELFLACVVSCAAGFVPDAGADVVAAVVELAAGALELAAGVLASLAGAALLEAGVLASPEAEAGVASSSTPVERSFATQVSARSSWASSSAWL